MWEFSKRMTTVLRRAVNRHRISRLDQVPKRQKWHKIPSSVTRIPTSVISTLRASTRHSIVVRRCRVRFTASKLTPSRVKVQTPQRLKQAKLHNFVTKSYQCWGWRERELWHFIIQFPFKMFLTHFSISVTMNEKIPRIRSMKKHFHPHSRSMRIKIENEMKS